MKQFYLKIASSDRAFYDGLCESLTLPTEDGEYAVWANHESMVVGITIGILRYTVDGVTENAVCGTGFARIADNTVTVLTDTIERPEEVDENRALAAKRRAEERLLLQKSKQEYYRGKLAMTRAMIRLKVKEKKYL